MLGSKQKTLHKSLLKFDPGRSFSGGASETLISADLGASKIVPEAGNRSTLALLAPQAVVRALTNSGGEAPNDLPFALSLDAVADWILDYEEEDGKLDAFEFLQLYWTRRLELDDDGSFDPETVVLPFLFAESLVNRTTHNGSGSEGSFTALLQKNKDGGVIWGQIKYTPINLYFMQLGAIALLNEIFLTQDYETVTVPAASAVRAITSVYLTRDVENLRDEDMDAFVAILNEYQALAMGIASSPDPRGELREILSSVEPESSPVLEALELGDNIAGPVIADQARAARDAILQKIELTEFKQLGETFANILFEATLVEVVVLMGALATEDAEEDSTPALRAASSTIASRFEGPRATSDFTRVAVGVLTATYVEDARTESETDDDIVSQISEIFRCVDLSSSEREAVNDVLRAWDADAHQMRVDDWFERREREDDSLPPVGDAERPWFEKTFRLLVRDALDLREFDLPEEELLQWWASILSLAVMRRDSLVSESVDAVAE